MSDTPPGAFNPNPGQNWGPPPASSSGPLAQKPYAPAPFGRPARWPAFAALAIALISLAVGLIGWVRPVSHNNPAPPRPTYSDEQVANAKANVCAAFGKVDHALDLAGARSGGSNDPTAQLAVATNTRQVLDAGGRYLLTKLAQEPATPPDLATAVRDQANSFQELMVGYLDELPNSAPEQQPALKASDEATATIRRLCK
jgi:hypothetical protein